MSPRNIRKTPRTRYRCVLQSLHDVRLCACSLTSRLSQATGLSLSHPAMLGGYPDVKERSPVTRKAFPGCVSTTVSQVGAAAAQCPGSVTPTRTTFGLAARSTQGSCRR